MPVILWNPINNANYWMMVVEKMRERGLDIEVKFYRLRQKRKVLVWITRDTYPVPMDSWGAEDIEPGRAVCMAALKAVEENNVRTP